MHSQMPFIRLTGSPSERGRQQGSLLLRLILEGFARLRRSTTPEQWHRAKSMGAKSFARLRAVAPDLTAELEGLAEATRLDILDVYLLSCFEYFDEGQTGCTSVGLQTIDGIFVAQNWDAPACRSEELVTLVHEDPERPFVTIASAGTLGWVGLNGAGLAFVNNDLIVDKSHEGMPSLAIRRLMLATGSVDEALEVLRTNDHLAGRCFVIGDATGSLSAAEVSPSAGIADAACPVIRHTNHPLLPAIAVWEDIEAAAQFYPSSRERLRAAYRLPLESTQDIEALLRDRTGAPDAICKSASQREDTETVFSVIFDCRRREAMIALGRPDRAPYQRFRLDVRALA
ncbi:Acyl-coenzyme A:6-aminopenicillanic acid acyl-transferase [Rhizobium sp. CF142]|nr:Acyl-coenzyme A:6-aminopenicillanic acid acyl-transferase [Rhizobium sp. CF142]